MGPGVYWDPRKGGGVRSLSTTPQSGSPSAPVRRTVGEGLVPSPKTRWLGPSATGRELPSLPLSRDPPRPRVLGRTGDLYW